MSNWIVENSKPEGGDQLSFDLDNPRPESNWGSYPDSSKQVHRQLGHKPQVGFVQAAVDEGAGQFKQHTVMNLLRRLVDHRRSLTKFLVPQNTADYPLPIGDGEGLAGSGCSTLTISIRMPVMTGLHFTTQFPFRGEMPFDQDKLDQVVPALLCMASWKEPGPALSQRPGVRGG